MAKRLSKGPARKDMSEEEKSALGKHFNKAFADMDKQLRKRLGSLFNIGEPFADAMSLPSISVATERQARTSPEVIMLLESVCDLAKRMADERATRILRALCIATDGGIDSVYHKMWVIDQMVRALTGCSPNFMSQEYLDWVARYESNEDGPNIYEWDTGIAP